MSSRLRDLRPVLEQRAELLHSTRSFFRSRGFLEIETPLRIPAPCMECHIDAEPAGNHYLRTSPELQMKELLAAGYKKIFQIGPCFRKGEYGKLHNPEYTMLEWYRTHADYKDVLRDTKNLLTTLVEELYPQQKQPLEEWHEFTVRDVFRKHAGWDPLENFDSDRFDIDMLEKIQPVLKQIKGPVVLRDYPAPTAALARLKSANRQVAERWELFLNGIEIANAYSELTDPREQEKRFAEWALKREKAGRDIYPIDEAFINALKNGLPPAGGIALGIDRLLLVLSRKNSFDEILPFRRGSN